MINWGEKPIKICNWLEPETEYWKDKEEELSDRESWGSGDLYKYSTDKKWIRAIQNLSEEKSKEEKAEGEKI